MQGHYPLDSQTNFAFHLRPFGGYGPVMVVGFFKKTCNCKTVNLGSILRVLDYPDVILNGLYARSLHSQTYLTFYLRPFGGYGLALLVGFSKKTFKTINFGSILRVIDHPDDIQNGLYARSLPPRLSYIFSFAFEANWRLWARNIHWFLQKKPVKWPILALFWGPSERKRPTIWLNSKNRQPLKSPTYQHVNQSWPKQFWRLS